MCGLWRGVEATPMSSLSRLIDRLFGFRGEERREMITRHFLVSIGFSIAIAVAVSTSAGIPWPSPQSLVIFLDTFLTFVALSLSILAVSPGVSNDDKTRSTALASIAIFLIGVVMLCVQVAAFFPVQG